MRSVPSVAGPAVVLLAAGNGAAAADRVARPNVLIVMTDDHGVGDFSFARCAAPPAGNRLPA
jgi:hypothetical protein